MAESDSPIQPPANEQPQPGSIIAFPGNQPTPPTAPPIQAPSNPQVTPPRTPDMRPAQAPVDPPQPDSFPVEESPWTTPESAEPSRAIVWTASEFIVHHKSPGWYVTLATGTIAGAFLVWLLTKDKISAGVVLFGALMLGILASRQPRQLEYRLDSNGLTIGEKHYPYDSFRSFSVVTEGAFSSIMFMPLKRFAAAVSIYYDPNDEAAIVELLSVIMPSEDRGKDALDRLMSRIRF